MISQPHQSYLYSSLLDHKSRKFVLFSTTHSVRICIEISSSSSQNLHSISSTSPGLLRWTLSQQCPIRKPVTMRSFLLLRQIQDFYLFQLQSSRSTLSSRNGCTYGNFPLLFQYLGSLLDFLLSVPGLLFLVLASNR